ncbi:actin-related protein 10-like [Xenia sp. Carnegie-2017]|uniref:actin-related protein 10-like n=1 Tax=Xenia sp. Carnegie-2017 TaxID=2897299 RepID=UPI001F04A1FA|nr:actin-related protein 10-like [Xenia sp. Carnegie-2017]
MPLFDVIGFGNEKIAVVLDIGEAYTKCGFASEVCPRHIIPSIVRRNINGEVSEEKITPNVTSNTDDGQLYGILRDFIHNIYFRYLLVNPKERRVVICESLLVSTRFRETLAKVLFYHFEVPSVLFAPSHLMSLFTLGVSTCLVMECGYSETTVLPIYDGVPMINSMEFLPIGAKVIHKRLESQLMEKGLVHIGTGIKPLSSVIDTLPTKVLEDIKVRTCFVGPKISIPVNETRPPSTVHSVDYPLDGAKILRVEGQIREQTFDVLFEVDEEEKSIATLMLDAVINSPIDTRKELAENIVVIGGTSMAPGFTHRLLQELHSQLQSSKYQNRLHIKTFKFHNPPVKANCVVWFGGSIFGSLEVLADRSVQRLDYIKKPSLPDWSSFSSHNEDNGDIGERRLSTTLKRGDFGSLGK